MWLFHCNCYNVRYTDDTMFVVLSIVHIINIYDSPQYMRTKHRSSFEVNIDIFHVTYTKFYKSTTDLCAITENLWGTSDL